MNNRTSEILEAAIKEYIESGEPVSSGSLFENYKFGIKPAMIRHVLNELTEAGYLIQPHHSAGRVPTDSGFEFFANQVFAAVYEGSRLAKSLTDAFSRFDLEALVDELSEELHCLGVACDIKSGLTRKEGLVELIEHLDWEERSEVEEVAGDVEAIDERLARLLVENDFLEYFIGAKSPVTKSDKLAIVAADYQTAAGRVFLMVMAPKRMNYQKAARIFKGLKDLQ